MSSSEIKVGNKYKLQNCKHKWNNGINVTITKIDIKADDYSCIDVHGNMYLVGIKNLKTK